MRASLPITITSCILVIGMTWWIGTRGKNFMTPPTESRLSEIREEVERSMPATDQPRDSVSAPSRKLITSPGFDPDRKHPMPIISRRDLEERPELNDYAKDSQHGAAYLIELAELLELNDEFERASLAWERVLDSTKPSSEQSAKAASAIHALRDKIPDWNSNPEKAVAITLHVGTAGNTATQIEPELIKATQEVEDASGGILDLKLNLITGEDSNPSSGPAPVAVWITGAKEDSKSTEILSFSVNTPDAVTLDASSTIYRLTRGYLSRHVKSLTPPEALGNPAEMQEIRSKITRLHWQKFGQSLNSTP